MVNYIINNQYDSVIRVVDYSMAYDKDPLLPVLKLAALGMRDVDFEKIIDSSLFLSSYQHASSAVSQWEAAEGVSSYSQMCSGMSKIIYASFYLKQKKYFSAIQNGFDGLDKLQAAQNADSTNYETDFFLGLYEYGRAELRSRLWWVLFWYPGNRAQGIARVSRCSQHAMITDEAAKLSLCDMFLQEKRNKEAKKIIDQMKQYYPESRFVLWAEVKYFEAEMLYEAAANVYSRLASSYKKEKLGEYNFLFTSSRQAQMLYKTRKITNAKQLCYNMLQDTKINKYKELKKETVKLLEQCNATDN